LRERSAGSEDARQVGTAPYSALPERSSTWSERGRVQGSSPESALPARSSVRRRRRRESAGAGSGPVRLRPRSSSAETEGGAAAGMGASGWSDTPSQDGESGPRQEASAARSVDAGAAERGAEATARRSRRVRMLWGRGNGASGMALVAGVGLAVRVLPGDWASGLGSAKRRQNGKAVWSERVGLLVAG
jgi:hypothetical protein